MQIKSAIDIGFDSGNLAEKSWIQNVFGYNDVTIYVGNHPQNSFIGLSATDDKNIYIHFNYLRNYSDAFNSQIIPVVQAMRWDDLPYQSPPVANGMMMNRDTIFLARALDTRIFAEGIFWQIGIETM